MPGWDGKERWGKESNFGEKILRNQITVPLLFSYMGFVFYGTLETSVIPGST